MLDRRSGTDFPSAFATGLNDLQIFDTAWTSERKYESSSYVRMTNAPFSSRVDDCYEKWHGINQVFKHPAEGINESGIHSFIILM